MFTGLFAQFFAVLKTPLDHKSCPLTRSSPRPVTGLGNNTVTDVYDITLVCWNRSGADETEPMGGTTNSIQLLHLAVQDTHTQLRLVIILCSIMVEMFKVLIG